MTNHDLELIDEASSTGYRDTIYRLLEEAESEECKEILLSILDDSDINWE